MVQRTDLVHPTLRHPRTGEPLLALGEIGGKVIWPVLGAGPEEDGNAGGESEGTEKSEGTEGEGEGEKGESKATAETVSKEEYDRLHNRMTAADKRSSDLQKKIAEFENAGKTESERLQQERDDALRARDDAATATRDLRIQTAFLSIDGVEWHNKSDALKMLLADYMDKIDIDDNGKVTGVDAAVKAMAKEKSYLVKTEPVSSAGDQMNGQRKGDQGGKDKKTREAELRKRLPALG